MPRTRRRKINPPKALAPVPTPEVLKRFLALCEYNPLNGCWVWLGHRDGNGYGQFKLNGQAVGAHRASYALFRGPVAEGKEIDHKRRKCPVYCVNPFHLRQLSPLANARDGGVRRQAKKDEIPF